AKPQGILIDEKRYKRKYVNCSNKSRAISTVQRHYLLVHSLCVLSVESLDDGDQALSAHLPIPVSHHRQIQLLAQGRPGQHHALPCLLFPTVLSSSQPHPQILHHVLCETPRCEVPPRHPLPEDLHRPRPCRAAPHRVQEPRHVQPRPPREHYRLAEPHDGATDRDLIRDLAALPASRRPHPRRPPERLEQRRQPVDHPLVAPGQDRQRPVPRPDVPARDRRVHGPAPPGPRRRRNLAREGRVAAGAVYEDAAGRDGGEGAGGGVEEGLADVGRVTDHGEQHVGGAGGIGRRGNEVGAEAAEVIGLGGGAGVDGNGVAGGPEAGGHGGAHDPGADPADTCHAWSDRSRIAPALFHRP
ncbi:unnamed protein product, partial [Musa acuminata subsp. malaccensis]